MNQLIIVIAATQAHKEAATAVLGARGIEISDLHPVTLGPSYESRHGHPKPGRLAALVCTEGEAAGLLKDIEAWGESVSVIHIGTERSWLGPQTGVPVDHRLAVGPDLVGQAMGSLLDQLGVGGQIKVECIAFSYRRGVPETQMVFDTRFLANPFWVAELRELSGLHPAVKRYVMRQPAARVLVSATVRMTRGLLPWYSGHLKGPLRLAFGCTGGRHRSVAIAQEVARRLRGSEELDVTLIVRDL